MEVREYVFQSPYPSAVQVGRPDPQASSSSENKEAVDAISNAGNDTLKEAKAYQSTVSSGASVNVAVSSTNSGVSSSLDTFSTLNTQVQASEAYEL